MTQEQILSLLDKALAEELGVVAEITNPEHFANEVKDARKDKPQYHELIIANPPVENTVIIYKRSVSLD